MSKRGLKLGLSLLLLTLSSYVAAANNHVLPFDLSDDYSPAIKLFLLMTVLSLAPSILIMLTSYTRIIIVLSMLRNALGLQQTPQNSILISLALFLTVFSMYPVFETIYQEAYLPYQSKTLSDKAALLKAQTPIKTFMLKQTRQKELSLILRLSKTPTPANLLDIPLLKLVPAFLLSELQTAFQMGFLIYIPFLLIDLLVSTILMTMGMMMMPPMSISLPIKLLVFVLVNGWSLVVEALVASFH